MGENSGALGRLARELFRWFLAIMGGIAGYQVTEFIQSAGWWPFQTILMSLAGTGSFVVVFGGVSYLIAPLFHRGILRLGSLLEGHLQNISWINISVGLIGLIVGLLLANLLALPFVDLPVLGRYLAILLNVALGYAMMWLFIKRRDDMVAMMGSVGGIWRDRQGEPRKRQGKYATMDLQDGTLSSLACPAKLLDTSVVIDGRILDVARTGFVEGALTLPRFVLVELQGIADSSDPVRRGRGRRGLDVINGLQKIPTIRLEILELSLKDLNAETVDLALVQLARDMGGKILTTDYNLNKISQIQGIDVLNVNDLANALKPMLLPGESLMVDVLREGKEQSQGVGYLDDGTMIVVEDGGRAVGRRVEVTVTSMLQTSAGRMIFGRIRRESAA